jgi:hypothetical protein
MSGMDMNEWKVRKEGAGQVHLISAIPSHHCYIQGPYIILARNSPILQPRPRGDRKHTE